MHLQQKGLQTNHLVSVPPNQKVMVLQNGHVLRCLARLLLNPQPFWSCLQPLLFPNGRPIHSFVVMGSLAGVGGVTGCCVVQSMAFKAQFGCHVQLP